MEFPESGMASWLSSVGPEPVARELREAVKAWKNKTPPALPTEQQLADLVRAYQDQQLVLVLGAGVSLVYNLPDWNTLLQTLLIGATTSGKPENRFIARLFIEVFRPTPLIAARYVRNYFRQAFETSAFEEAVRNALYEAEIGDGHASSLIREICAFILAPARSPMLDAVITYNFDDILERELERLSAQIGIRIPYRCIYAPTERSERELPIYHVHGYLPSGGSLSAANNITLGEADYHHQYSRVYSWENTVQINKFADARCLFIGTSFSDPNLRRLLDIAKDQHQDESSRHYVVRKRPNVTDTMALLKRRLDESPELLDEKLRADLCVEQVAADLIELETRFEETDARSFGVSTIWVDEFDDIPDLLKTVREQKSSQFLAVKSRAAEAST